MSIAAAAMVRSVNANLLRRWVIEAERAEELRRSAVKALPAPSEAFVALPMPTKTVEKAAIRIEVRRGTLTVSVHWPSSAMHECAIWLREVLK
jgi:transposase-like protein